MQTEYETIKISLQDGIALLTIDNPPVNPMSVQLELDLREAFAEAMADPGVKALILTGTGKNFIAGADITKLQSLKTQRGRFCIGLVSGHIVQCLRDSSQTGGHGHQRQLPGRRPGGRPGRPLPGGGARGGHGSARSPARCDPRGGRDSAAAPTDRFDSGTGDDRLRPAGQRGRSPGTGTGRRSGRPGGTASGGPPGRPALPVRGPPTGTADDRQQDGPTSPGRRERGPHQGLPNP